MWASRGSWRHAAELTLGCCTGASVSERRFRRSESRSPTCSRSPSRRPASPGWGSSTCSDLCSTTEDKERQKRKEKLNQTCTKLNSMAHIWPQQQQKRKWFAVWLFQEHTRSRQGGGPSWFCRSKGCPGDCTTAAYMGRMCETVTRRQRNRQLHALMWFLKIFLFLYKNIHQKEFGKSGCCCHRWDFASHLTVPNQFPGNRILKSS